MENKPKDMPVSDEILELIFRSAPEAMDATTVARVLGVSGNRDALIDLGFWLRLLSTDEHGPPQVAGQVTAFGEQMMREIFRSAWAKRPAKLDTHRLACVPERTNAGDELVILYGLTAPLVIRPVCEGRHKIIGPAHTSGVMQGQAMELSLPSAEYVLV
jgi:hypothetical protein